MTRYQLINKSDAHACFESNDIGDWVSYEDYKNLADTHSTLLVALEYNRKERDLLHREIKLLLKSLN